MKLVELFTRRRPRNDQKSVADAFSSLVLAAREDAAFREQLMLVVKLPANQRESMVTSAVAEMTLRGESVAIRTAFASLATAEGADLASRLIECV
jgi:hypothetical protein